MAELPPLMPDRYKKKKIVFFWTMDEIENDFIEMIKSDLRADRIYIMNTDTNPRIEIIEA
jgi:hypothetical protein